MAESIDSLVTPVKDVLQGGNISKKYDGNQDSLSTGGSSGTSPRRPSAGSLRSSADKSESGYSSQRVVPRYLRPSTGSCHDFCKFGKANSVETKERKPFRRRIAKPLLTELSHAEIPVEILASGSKKKEDVVTCDQKKEDVVTCDQKREEVVTCDQKKEEVVSGGEKKKEVLIGGQKREEVVLRGQKKKVVAPSDMKKKEVVSGVQKKEEVVKRGLRIHTKDHSTDQNPSPDTKSHLTKPKILSEVRNDNSSTYTNNHLRSVPSHHNKSNLRKPQLSISSKTYSPKKNDSSGSKTLSLKPKFPSAKKSPSVGPSDKSVCSSYTEVEGSVKQGSPTDDKISRTVKKATSMGKQQLFPVKLKPVKVKPSPASDDSAGMDGKDGRNNSAQTGRKLMTAKASSKKILAPPSANRPSMISVKKKAQVNSAKPGNLKLASPLKDPSRIQRVNTKVSSSEKVAEETLHLIRVETGNNTSGDTPGNNEISSPQCPLSAESSSQGNSLSSSSSQEQDDSDSEESAVEVDEIISSNSSETGKEALLKESPKKAQRKNRGIVPEDKHVSPVKLKFRMGKVVELQTDNNSPRRLRFRRTRVLGVEETKGGLSRKISKKASGNSGMASTAVSSQKVVLKHQDVQEKKDAQGLLNNVIEETASKLAESRKSKVKALVGAFETVISLQESKPSTQAVT